MKKVYLLVSGLLLTAGAVNAQTTLTEREAAPAQYATDANVRPTIAPRAGDRDADDIIWENDFSDAADWIGAGPSGDFAESGWTVGTVTDSWWGGMEADMGTTGNFARFRNGNTTDFVADGPFTFMYDGVIDLTGIPAPHLEFEQYGARFITLQAVEVSTDGGTTWVQVGNNDDIPPLTAGGGAAYGRPETRRFNITSEIAADPSNVMVRLFWDGAMNGADINYIDYGWYVDNIRIVEGHPYDSDIQAAYFRTDLDPEFNPSGLEYYQMPLDQAAPITFSAVTINQGGSTFSDLTLNVDVTTGGASVFSGTSAAASVAASERDSSGVSTTFTPTALGTHTITWSYTSTEVDTYSPNDELTDDFEVTEYFYSRHDGFPNGSISDFSGNTGSFAIGNEMHIFADDEIGGMYVRITNNADHVGKLFFGQIYLFDEAGGAYTYLDQTPDMEVTDANNGTEIYLEFENAIEVTAGQDILVLGSSYTGGEINYATAQSVDQGTVIGISGDGSFGSLIDPEAVMITLEMRDVSSVEEVASTNFSVGQNMPNPFGENTIINYELNEAANVSVEIMDLTGKVVTTINNGTQAAGAYTLALSANDYAEGVYFYTFRVGAEQVTKRMVITK